jgi:hypothetical protein
LGHEVALQTQSPPEQIWPVPHAVLPPHVQTPAAEHPSAVTPQLAHAPPPVPQLVADGGEWQMAPVQQPLAHDVESQTHVPLWHLWPGPQAAPAPHLHAPPVQLSAFVVSQAAQLTPLVPHADRDGTVQTLPVQQPVGQDAALQTHTPPEHA